MSTSGAEHPLGSARIMPTADVIAGSYGTWQITYTVGREGVQRGGRIRVETESDTDWGFPQVADPTGEDYITVEAPAEAGVAVQVVNHKRQDLVVTGRALQEGEEVAVTLGDRSGGGPGSRAQTFIEPHHYFYVSVDGDGSGHWVELPDPPELSIVGGSIDRLVVVAPSDAVMGEPFSLLVRAEDAWGNPAMQYRGTVHLSSSDGVEIPDGAVEFRESDQGVRMVDGCTVPASGIYRVSATDDRHNLAVESNPVVARDEAPEMTLYWGDPHGGQVVDARKIEDFFGYARDVAGIHFTGYQRNDHSMSNDDYALQQQFERTFYDPANFIPLPGFEWSPGTELGGHHNVYFRRFDQPVRRSSHSNVEDKSDIGDDLTHITDVYRAYRGNDLIITPHVGGQHSDLTYHEPTLEPALEMTSDHGSFEWFLEESLANGYKMGFLGGSDSHNGRPGNDTPGHQLRRYAKSGLTGLYAQDLTLPGVIEAMKARRCYATTGARIVASVTADGHFIGDEYLTSGSPEIRGSIVGTAPLERVQVFRGLEPIYDHDLGLGRSPNRVRISWEGASRKSSYSGVVWDGQVRVQGGAITNTEVSRFDSPRSHVSGVSAGELAWHSWTCGYRSGITLDIDGDGDTLIETVVETSTLMRTAGGSGPFPQITFAPQDRVRLQVKLSELLNGPHSVDLGPVNRKVTVELAPESPSRQAEFAFTDDSPKPGINPYWVRGLQVDGEMVWTSPIFVDYVPDPLKTPYNTSG